MSSSASPGEHESSGFTGLLLVSHSGQLAAGLVELAAQMAPQVPIEGAGGMPDGSLGNSYDPVLEAARKALERATSLAVLTDLGSATMIAESVAEELAADGEQVTVIDAPFVEGAVAAAVTAQNGGDPEQVAQAARDAAAHFTVRSPSEVAGQEATAQGTAAPSAPSQRTPDRAEPVQARTLVLHNKLGLHARPAAMLARVAGSYDAHLEVNGAQGTSVLALMSLGLVQGDTLELRATGDQAAHVLDAVGDIVADRFGEE